MADRLLALVVAHQEVISNKIMTLNAIIIKDDETISVRFSQEKSPSERVISIELVLDFDQNGEVIGIEIINLKWFGGQNSLPVEERLSLPVETQINFSYDDEADAAYIRILEASSKKQRAVEGWLEINSNGQLVGVRAKLI